MNSIFPQGGLSQAYTALARFVGVEQNTARGQNFAAQVKKAGSSDDIHAEDALNARARTSNGNDGSFKEYFVSNATSFDQNAPRGSYINIVV